MTVPNTELTEEQKKALDPPPAITEGSQNPPSNLPISYTKEDMERTHNLYGEALREQTVRSEKLERELAEARNRSTQPISELELTPAQLIDRQVKASVQPLIDEFAGFKSFFQADNYSKIKNQFRNLPNLAAVFPNIEPYVDQEMQGKEISVQNVHNAIAMVIGKYQLQVAMQPNNGQQQQQPPQQNRQQPNNSNDNMLPPHLRPSNPPAPDRSINRPAVQLTELQKRVARERGMSDEDYIAWIDVDPMNVVNSKIGIPVPPKS